MQPLSSESIAYTEHENKIRELMKELMKLKQTKLEKNLMDVLHPAVYKRVQALMILQKKAINLDAKLQRKVFKLECKFQSKLKIVYKKREQIINGMDEEYNSGHFSTNQVVPDDDDEIPEGIPNFWLTVLKNVRFTNRLIQHEDEEVLGYLTNIRSVSKSYPELSFTIEFQFKPNPFFENSVLTKTYLLNGTPDEDVPFSFEGLEIVKTIGCEIMWNDGFNVTQKIQENEISDCIITVDSFFDFFNPPELKNEITHEECFIDQLLEMDFELGRYLKERVIPRAVFYYLGETEDFSDGEVSLTDFIEDYERNHGIVSSEEEN